jgi:hypothetical protein
MHAPRSLVPLLLLALALATGAATCRDPAAERPARPSPPTGAPTPEPQLTLRPSGGQPVTVAVEIVTTPAARARGLMFRRTLASTAGMLFVFEEEDDYPFWMKDTYIPLDLIYIDAAGRVVGILEDLRPLDETSRSVGAPALYVLEVNAGSARRWGLRPGDAVELPRLP